MTATGRTLEKVSAIENPGTDIGRIAVVLAIAIKPGTSAVEYALAYIVTAIVAVKSGCRRAGKCCTHTFTLNIAGCQCRT
jgi:hypothetical protein